MYEHRSRPLLSVPHFVWRMVGHLLLAGVPVLLSLGIGVLGYRRIEGLPWIDALLNASMILGGMGPVAALHTVAGKLFASCYALFSGMIFLVAMGIVWTPVAHRLMHRLHVDAE